MIKEEEIRKSVVMEVAELMIIAARTAPKARGIDNLFAAILTDEEVQKLADMMDKMVVEEGAPSFFSRDAGNLRQSQVVVMLGTSISSLKLPMCGYCGFINCDYREKQNNIPCAFNTGDLGIAIGSAVSIAANHRIDNRIMFSAGYVAVRKNLLPPEVKIAYAIPLSVSAKSPYFDRK